MLKEIKKEKDVITNQDLFNEIIKKVKKSDKWPSSIIDYELEDHYEIIMSLILYSLCSQAVMKDII